MKERPTDRVVERLHVCPACDSALVQPTYWEQQGDRSRWRVWRRCPECEWTSVGVHGGIEIDAFDEQLDQATHQLADGLRALERESMRAMAGAFIIALDNDLISADDFA